MIYYCIFNGLYDTMLETLRADNSPHRIRLRAPRWWADRIESTMNSEISGSPSLRGMLIASTCILAFGGIGLGANLAETYRLPVFHTWGLAHGMFPVLFPIYCVMLYWLLRPIFQRFGRITIAPEPGLSKYPKTSVFLSCVGFLVPLLALGGIIAGHLTRARCEADSEDGAGLARVGLSLGYGSLGCWACLVIVMFLQLRDKTS